MRSESDKEKTKLRERQRRAITRKVFYGLRKHGGYNLSPRADINEVLRHLAMESGWTILPDGTTYRSDNSNSNSKALTGASCPTPAIECPTTNSPQPRFGGPVELFMYGSLTTKTIGEGGEMVLGYHSHGFSA